MRLFIAVDLDSPTRDLAAGVIAELRCHLRVGHASIKWVAPPHLHFTLAFLGEVGGDRVEAVRQAMVKRWHQQPFRAGVSSLGVFPPFGTPRVVWLGIGEGRAELEALQDAVRARFGLLGFPPEQRAFRPHLTLGRVRRTTPASGLAVRDALGRVSFPGHTWRVDRVV